MVGNTLYYMKKRKQNIPIYCIMDTVCNGIGQEAAIYCIINTVWFYRNGNDMTGCRKIYLDS